MPVDIALQDCEDYLFGVVSGTIDNVEELVRFSESVVNAVVSRSTKRVLFDMQHLEDMTSYYDGVTLGEMDIVAEMARKGVRFASVHKPDNVGQFRHYETIFSIRSVKYKVFVEVVEALAWLRG